MKITATSYLTDEELINEYLNGDNVALGILYNRYYKKVFHKCLSFTKNSDDAFDFAQDILIKAFSKSNSFKGISKFSTWLFSITHNYCITQISKSNKTHFEDIHFHNNLKDDYIDNIDLEERKNRENIEVQLFHYLDELSDTDKAILELKYRQNYSIKDLQEKFNLSASAIKMRLMRARQKVEFIYNTYERKI